MEKLLNEEHIPFKLLSKKEGYEIQKNWLNLFASEVLEKTGKYQVGNFLWENFGSELQPSLTNTKAVEEYKKCKVEPLYIFNEGCNQCYYCQVSKLPEFPDRSGDIYIIPFSKEWTMVYSHMGEVYFATKKT